MSSRLCNYCKRDVQACGHPAALQYKQDPKPMPFEDQLARILPYVDDQHQFLAGVRFAQGFNEHGDSLMRMSDAELEMAKQEEYADAIVYAAEQAARSRPGHVVTSFEVAYIAGEDGEWKPL